MLVIGDEPKILFCALNTTSVFPVLVKGGTKSYRLDIVFPFRIKLPVPLAEFTKT